MKVPIRSNLIKTYASSAASKKAGEGVPYETVLKGGVTPEQTLPEEADVVVLGTDLLYAHYLTRVLKSLLLTGGGSIGCNTLYHLTKLGIKNVVLLERNRLTSGTTWHTGMTLICILHAFESSKPNSFSSYKLQTQLA